ncbi:facilitated trehalose transporter Tret1-2 homolog isoform X4 [Planococcus citri]|uniref:facilitated trehalose transporter Tret1-2 homolog isoform X2 n=1 Tax=Planococcus citri TaxID=170843 RepID=UPI0031F878B2
MDTSHMEKREEFVGMLKENQNKSAVKQEGNKLPQYVCAIIASIGAFVIGTVLAWTSPTLKLLETENSTAQLHIAPEKTDENTFQRMWISALTPLGAILGALPAGYFADLLGRKKTMIFFTVPWIVSWALLIFGTSVAVIYISRFLTGIITGLFCAVLPLYVNEISEDSVRGSLGTLFQVFLTLGILFDYTLTLTHSYLIVNLACGAVTVLFFAVAFLLPESHVYLMKKNNRPEAEKSLRRLRGPYFDIHVELNELRKNLENAGEQSLSYSEMFTPVNIKALAIALGLMLSQQLSGINAVIFFAEDIFTIAGVKNAALCTIGMGVVQSMATVASSVLVEKAGRRLLLLISSIGMGVTLIVLGYYFKIKDDPANASLGWLPIVCLFFFIIVFSLGLGPLPWMMSGELLSPEIKSFGSGVAVATNWICVSIITGSFGSLTKAIGESFAFWLFAVIVLIAAAFVFFFVPETKGKSVQDIQLELAGKKPSTQSNGNA